MCDAALRQVNPAAYFKGKTAVIFNTDMGIDDALAIMLWKILGDRKPDYFLISPGNTTMEHALRNIAILKKWTGLTAAVVKGEDLETDEADAKSRFHGADGFADISDAVIAREGLTEADFGQYITTRQLKEKLKQFDSVIYYSVGPVTTLAELIRDGDILKKIRIAYIMGGGIERFNCPHCTEFNFAKDPAGVKAVLESGLNIILFPLDITDTQQVKAADIDALRQAGAPEDIITLLRYNLASNRQNNIDGAVMHDSVPVLFTAFPQKFTVKEMKLDSDRFGRTFVSESGTPVLVATAVEEGLLMKNYRRLAK